MGVNVVLEGGVLRHMRWRHLPKLEGRGRLLAMTRCLLTHRRLLLTRCCSIIRVVRRADRLLVWLFLAALINMHCKDGVVCVH